MILSMPTKTRRINMNPTNYAKALDQMKHSDTLSPEEQKLYDALCLVDTKSYYGQVILEVFRDYTVLKFRELVQELLSQRDDDSYAVYKILGKTAYDCLLVLKKKL